MTTSYRALLSMAACAAIVAGELSAQSLGDRIARVREGDVRLSFAIRPDLCGYGNGIRRVGADDRTVTWSSDLRRRDVVYDYPCDQGPGRLVVAKIDGEVVDLRFYVGGRWRESSTATDLGQVSASQAADFLIGLSETLDSKPGREAIFPASLIDSVTIWPRLLRLARNETRPRAVREQAVFWLGQAAGEAAIEGLRGIVEDDTVNREVRKQAVFALSQQRDGMGVPSLIRVVRTSRDPELRKSAMFWLAQTRDPRALELIEELLTKR